MFRNVLVCVDESEHSRHALSEAIDIAATENSRLTILTAVTRPPGWVTTPTTVGLVGPLAAELEQRAQRTLEDAVKRVPESIPVTRILTHEPIRDALAEQVQSGDYDLVVLGTRGRGALGASLMGSVSHYALNHSHVPVLIVRAEGEGDRDDPAARATASPPQEAAAVA